MSEYAVYFAVAAPLRYVYARQAREGTLELFRLADGRYACEFPCWIVWSPDTVELEFVEDEEFGKRYVHQGEAPAAVRSQFPAIPTYAEWCDGCDANPPVEPSE